MLITMSIQGAAIGAAAGVVISLLNKHPKDIMSYEVIQGALLGVATAFLRVQFDKAVAIGGLFTAVLFPLSNTPTKMHMKELHLKAAAFFVGALAAGFLSEMM
jgi:hypothetical protein